MGKELLMKVLNHEDTGGQLPWVPFAGVHAGKLKGYSGKEVLTDASKLIESLREVHKLYEPDGMPIVFDLQLEAEILGCDLLWADYNPPSVITHLYDKEKGIPCKCKFPTPESGRIPIVLEAMRVMKEEVGDDTALYGLITGPLTLASHLRGSDVFKDMRKDPEYVKMLASFCAEYAQKMAELYIDAGMDVIAVVDPLVSQIAPKVFSNLFHDSFKAVFDFIRMKGVKSSFFVCGNASYQIEVMCETGPDSMAVDENVDMVPAKATTDKYNIALSGNIPLTTTMLFGTQQDNMKGVLDLMDSLENKKNLIISPGCDMPYDTPMENTVACAMTVHNPEEARAMVVNYSATSFDDIEVEIPDYANTDKVLIELFTLDPEQCAACTYMVKSVTDIYDEIKDIADYVVYKYFIKEDIARTAKMGLTNLPTMCIDGESVYISIIPDRDELIQQLTTRYNAKKGKHGEL
ncbi:uroporphyrinogen decarboxylase family protein [Parasporobacterium paucivorans]|uniref:Uroporphyrinogen decarboxylase n=1 Tax=Parasporobacterium paucivorans DSM 15970 TaxID=1122934 RepID=A0A1M6IH08_9FIRM|nr:uroporphyrinogen decarboxylase family protein [Parasporobacterium paucivorans]SHJ33781.1 uroporphyrinogen decarboxylase [Parasporobacterium paucivorans DSM 15970]